MKQKYQVYVSVPQPPPKLSLLYHIVLIKTMHFDFTALLCTDAVLVNCILFSLIFTIDDCQTLFWSKALFKKQLFRGGGAWSSTAHTLALCTLPIYTSLFLCKGYRSQRSASHNRTISCSFLCPGSSLPSTVSTKAVSSISITDTSLTYFISFSHQYIKQLHFNTQHVHFEMGFY